MSELIPFNKWTKWSPELLVIPFETSVKGIGPGEDRVAAVFNTKPLGQNIDYDLNLNKTELFPKGEVKSLDAAKSFKTAKNGRDCLRVTKSQIIALQIILKMLVAEYKMFLNATLLNDCKSFSDVVSPDEICEKNIKILKSICKELYELRREIASKQTKTYSCFHPISASKIELNSFQFYKMLLPLISSEEIKEKLGEDQYITNKLLELLTHPYIDNPQKLSDELDGLSNRLFGDKTLIFVDKEKGYYINTDLSKIKFNRITLGYPRFVANV
jgi:hypothetical protein